MTVFFLISYRSCFQLSFYNFFSPHQIIKSSGRECHIAMRQYFKNNLVTHCPCLIGCQSFLFLRLIFPRINPLVGGGELKKHYSFYQIPWRDSWTRVTSCPSLPRTEGVSVTWMGLVVLKPVESGAKWDDLGVLILVVTHISKWIFRIVVEKAGISSTDSPFPVETYQTPEASLS